MAKAFFSRRVPFGLIPAYENRDSEGFDSYPVEVEEKVLMAAVELRQLANTMKDMYANMPAPEECAQTEADFLASNLASIIEGWKNG